MSSDNRKYKRLATNWGVKIRATKYTETTVRRMQERIKNISTGGVFIETAVPLDVGTHVEFSFQMPGRTDEIHAKGIVKWANAGHLQGMPVGMGIEFLEVATHSKEAIQDYVATESTKEALAPLVRSEAHRNLLKIYCRKIGESFPVDVLAQFLGCKPVQLLDAVRDYAAARLVTFANNTVTFVSCEDADLAKSIDAWYQAASAAP